MKKTIGFTVTIIIALTIILGMFTIQQYFAYVGPELARKQSYDADLEALKVEKVLSKAVEERIRGEATTNFYYYSGWVNLAAEAYSGNQSSKFFWQSSSVVH